MKNAAVKQAFDNEQVGQQAAVTVLLQVIWGEHARYKASLTWSFFFFRWEQEA